MSEGFNDATTGRQLCVYCRTELSADAIVCEACGMSQSNLTAPALRPPPAPPAVTAPALRLPPEVADGLALTGPALRPAPEPPAMTAATLRPAPEPPTASDDPLQATPPPSADDAPRMVSGDPLAAEGTGESAAGDAPSSGGEAAARPGTPPPVADPSGAASSPFAAWAPGATPPPADPPAAVEADAPAEAGEPSVPEAPASRVAHPSDETPEGYFDASLWPDSRRPTTSPVQPANTPDAPAIPAEAASVARPALGSSSETLPPMPAAVAPLVPELPGQAPAPPHTQPPPSGPNRARIDGKTAGIVAGIVALAAAVVVALIFLTGGSDPKPPVDDTPVAVVETATAAPAKTAKPKPAKLAVAAQVKQLDELMKLSKKGRSQAVNGDIKAATASRATLLKDLKTLDAKTTDKQLKAAVASFEVAITEALRQNRECGSKCSNAELDKVGKLKQAALKKINPLLKAHGTDTYTRAEI